MEPLKRYIRPRLERLEQYTEVSLRSFLRGWTWLFSGQIIGTFAAVLLALGYAHFLSQETYGTYKFILSVLSVLTVLSLPGMSEAAQRGIAKGNEGIFWKTLRLRVAWGAASALAAVGIGTYYFLNGNSLLAAVFTASAPFLIVLDSFGHFNSLLMGRQLFRQASYYSAFIQIASSLAIFGAVLVADDVLVLIIAYLMTFVVLRGLALIHVIHTFPPNDRGEDGALHYGSHVSVMNLVSTAVGQLDTILLWHFLGPVPLAIYAFADAAASQIRKAFKLVTTSMAFPRFSGRSITELQRTLPRKVLLAHAVTIPLAGAFVFVVPFIYQVLFPTYLESIPFAQALVALLAFAPLRFISTAISAKAPVRDIYIVNLTGAALRTVFLLALVPLYGIWGVIFAIAATMLIANIVALWVFSKLTSETQSR